MVVRRVFGAPAFSETVPKSGICLHYSAGSSVSGAVAHWKKWREEKGYPIGTPYLIDRDGTIHEVFDPAKQWAWHLGIGRKAVDSRLIGIELINWGFLVQSNGRFNPAGFPMVSIPAADVMDRGQMWRGYRYWQRYPDSQIKALKELLRHLCERFRIPWTLPPKAHQGGQALWPEAREFRGIVSHEHLRADKCDVGPAFPWEQVATPE